MVIYVEILISLLTNVLKLTGSYVEEGYFTSVEEVI
ncbi:hypothetical protein N783_01555 [Pontibacillus marinus BH030004 = DSM 16465]|uniref:Uncharacterized protein n=1 Tax=Pontibacillus marinus BH030004 = DSM 16465 TaxID=1385511 RepID=A0A0A5GAK3_9BACI|nr:hypothetical protein N783_01555 [Pontibacillus marinus BH030004 = DSM 16465]